KRDWSSDVCSSDLILLITLFSTSLGKPLGTERFISFRESNDTPPFRINLCFILSQIIDIDYVRKRSNVFPSLHFPSFKHHSYNDSLTIDFPIWIVNLRYNLLNTYKTLASTTSSEFFHFNTVKRVRYYLNNKFVE